MDSKEEGEEEHIQKYIHKPAFPCISGCIHILTHVCTNILPDKAYMVIHMQTFTYKQNFMQDNNFLKLTFSAKLVANCVYRIKTLKIPQNITWQNLFF